MVITVGGEPGGVGKTTLATSLAALLAGSGRTVVLVDADAQEAASKWLDLRAELHPDWPQIDKRTMRGYIDESIQSLRGDYNDVVVDVGGGDVPELRAALTVADLFLMPLAPNQRDIWTMEKMNAVVRMARKLRPTLRALTFPNFVHPASVRSRSAMFREAVSEWASFEVPDVAMTYRVAYPDAFAEGGCVAEVKPVDPKAVRELRAIYKEVQDHVEATVA